MSPGISPEHCPVLPDAAMKTACCHPDLSFLQPRELALHRRC